MALKVKQLFYKDETHSVPLEELKDITHRSFLQRLWESLVRLLSPLL